ncbi:hypothetical protein [Bacillus altitudinis]|uniref:hypothetical protein n=1 Tax=Bacillus altitudinis TaxID=293387 RepID=UPI0033152E8C
MDIKQEKKPEKLELETIELTAELEKSQLEAATDSLEFNFGVSRIHEMEHKSSKVVIYSNGTFETSTVLFDDSRHRKYGNTITFSLQFADSSSHLCNISSFSANFSPDEEKTYPTTGENDCVKTNFDLVKEGKLKPSMYWKCWKR